MLFAETDRVGSGNLDRNFRNNGKEFDNNRIFNFAVYCFLIDISAYSLNNRDTVIIKHLIDLQILKTFNWPFGIIMLHNFQLIIK